MEIHQSRNEKGWRYLRGIGKTSRRPRTEGDGSINSEQTEPGNNSGDVSSGDAGGAGDRGDSAGKPLIVAAFSKQALPWLILGVLVGAWLVWLFAGSSEFGECIRQRKEYHTYQALHENPIFIFALWVRFHLNSSCTAHTLNAYGGAVAALAGVIVAGFTGTLWWSTEKMWTLAQQQRLTDKRVRAEDNRRFEETLKVSKRDADAADRAVAHAISVTKMELRPWVYVHIAIGTREYRDPNNDEYASVVFEIANYGRMPASIERCVVGATTGKTPEGILRDQYHDVIAPGERKKAQDYFPGNLIYRRVFNNLDSDDESFLIPEVESGQHVLFYISIDYLGIDPSIGYKTVCCWRWDFGVNYWVQYNDPQYNYRT